MSKELVETAPWMSSKYDMHWRFQKCRIQEKERKVIKKNLKLHEKEDIKLL